MTVDACGKPDARQRARPVWRAEVGKRNRGNPVTAPPSDPTSADRPPGRQPLLPVGLAPLRARLDHHYQQSKFGAWGEVFGDTVIASAILDRLLHHSITINIKGESFRLKEKLKAGLLKPKLDSLT